MLKKTFWGTMLSLSLSLPAQAAIYNVNDVNDVIDMEGCNETHCSLREAVLASNANLVDAENIINLTIPDTYKLSRTGSDDEGLIGDLDILGNLPNGALKSVSIVGLGADTTIIDATDLQVPLVFSSRVIHVPEFLDEEENVNNFVALTLQDLAITGGEDQSGGGVLVLGNLEGSTLLTVNNCDVYNNKAGVAGGIGFGLLGANNSPNKDLIINNSLLRSNSSEVGGALVLQDANAEINNSTFTLNDAPLGSAIFTASSMSLSAAINSSTITGNTSGVAILAQNNEATLFEIELANTILSGNDGECTDTAGTNFISNGYNIFGDLMGCSLMPGATDQIVADTTTIFDPAGLADNGGPTQTIALLATGEAVDKANPEGCFNGDGDPTNNNNTKLLSDQRVDALLYPRISGAACDVGAFELRQEADLSIVKLADSLVVKNGDQLTYQIQVTNNGPAVANNVTMSDVLPQEAEFVEVNPAAPTCNFDQVSREVKCSFEKILPEEVAVATIVVTVVSEGNEVMTNTATATPGNETDPNLDNNTSSIDIDIQDNGFIEGSGVGCSLNNLATSSSASWMWMMSGLSLFFAVLRARRS